MILNSEFCLWPQADNDLRKFLAMREQALSNRDPGSDQETAREANNDDSERLERVQIHICALMLVCVCCPTIFHPTELVGPFMAAGSRFLDLRSKGDLKGAAQARGEILSRGHNRERGRHPNGHGWRTCPGQAHPHSLAKCSLLCCPP